MLAMAEPHASEFCRLVRQGAGAQDIHEGGRAVGFARRTSASDAFVSRELGRVDVHRRSSCALLEAFVGQAPRVLDVGCSTGASAVAMALSRVLDPDVVVGVDPDPLSLRAAEVRARGHGFDSARVDFVPIRPGKALPFTSGSFDLATCVSVLEFVPTTVGRRRLVEEIKRVVRPGGHVFLSTPSPLRLRDVHAKRWLGDIIRREGYPWSMPPWSVRSLVMDCERVPIESWLAERALESMGVRTPKVPGAFAEAFAWTTAWQKVLVRKPAGPTQPRRAGRKS